MIRRFLHAIVRYLRTPPGNLADDVSQSIEEEIEAHLAHSIDEHLSRGMNADDAQHVARAKFGRVAKAVRGCHDVWYRDQLAVHRAHLLLTGVLLAVVAMWWSFGPRRAVHTPTTAAAGARLPGDLVGRVIDERSAPIGQAHILAVVKTWPNNGYRQQAHMATTGPDGSFHIDDVYPLDEQYEVQLAVLADGRLLESRYVSDAAGELEPFVFQLQPTRALQVQFRGPDGLPVAGVATFPHRRIDAAGHDHLVYFQSADPIVQRSNAQGEVRMSCFHAGDQATVYFRTPGGEWQTRELVVPNQGTSIVLETNGDSSRPNASEDKGT